MTAAFAKAAIRQIVNDDLSGGTVTYGGTDYPATVGAFTLQDVLSEGGWTKKLMATVTMVSEDATTFDCKTYITVNPTAGDSRDCRIESVRDMGALTEIDVFDVNQGA